jgi:Trypsin-co-occurring domain 1
MVADDRWTGQGVDLMAYLLDSRKRMVAEVDPADVDGEDLVLASPDPGKVAARTEDSLERSLQDLGPALSAVLGNLREMAPSELSVQFGGEAGVILAKGATEVNLAVTMTWKDGRSVTGV